MPVVLVLRNKRACCRAPHLIQMQLLEIVREIATHDYPELWTSLIPDTLQTLQAHDAHAVLAALKILRNVAKRLEFSTGAGPTDRLQVRSSGRRRRVLMCFPAGVLLGHLLVDAYAAAEAL